MKNPFQSFVEWRSRPPEADDDAPLTGARLYGFLLLHNFWSLMGLSCLTALLCLPILTLPAALSGFARVCFELVSKGRCACQFSTFWKEFRQDFVRRLAPGLLLLLLPPVLGTLGVLLGGPVLGAGLLLAGVCMTMPAACYLYLLFAAAALPVGVNAKNAVILALRSGFPLTLRLLLLTAAPLGLGWLLFPYSVPLLLLTPGFVGIAVCRRILPVVSEAVLREPEYKL